MQSTDDRPLLALTLGDPSGVGPEVCFAARADARVRAAARLVFVGPASLRPQDMASYDAEQRAEEAWLESDAPAAWELGRASAAGGSAALAALRAGHELAYARRVEALVTAPVSKEALALAGESVEGQTTLLARWCDAPQTQMLAVAGELRVLLLSRHLPLREAIELVRKPRVLAHLHQLDHALRTLGVEAPRIALAGLNPHAGEGGLLGAEDEAELVPAVAEARAAGLDVEGPLSPDALFARAAEPNAPWDGVLALYHDQAFVPVKLAAPRNSLTVLVGLPYLRVSPAHGTAFDIAGQGVVSPENLISALLAAARWARARRDERD